MTNHHPTARVRYALDTTAAPGTDDYPIVAVTDIRTARDWSRTTITVGAAARAIPTGRVLVFNPGWWGERVATVCHGVEGVDRVDMIVTSGGVATVTVWWDRPWPRGWRSR